MFPWDVPKQRVLFPRLRNAAHLARALPECIWRNSYISAHSVYRTYVIHCRGGSSPAEDHPDNCARPVDTMWTTRSLSSSPFFLSPFLVLSFSSSSDAELETIISGRDLDNTSLGADYSRSNSERAVVILGILPGCTAHFCAARSVCLWIPRECAFAHYCVHRR